MVSSIVAGTISLAAVIGGLLVIGRVFKRPLRWVWRKNISDPLKTWSVGIIKAGAKEVLFEELLDPEQGALVRLTARVAVLEHERTGGTHLHVDQPTITVQVEAPK